MSLFSLGINLLQSCLNPWTTKDCFSIQCFHLVHVLTHLNQISHNVLRVHRIIGRFWLGETFKGYLAPLCHGQGHIQLIIRSIESLQVLFNVALETSKDEVLQATCASAFQA